MKVVRSARRTGRLYPPGNIPGTHFCYRLSRPQGHSVAGRIMSIKNSNVTIGNRTCDLPACRTVIFPGGRGGRFIRPTTLPPSCAECLAIWEVQPPWNTQALSRPVQRFILHLKATYVQILIFWFVTFSVVGGY